MLQPCFAAMLDGVVIATNPPTGLTAVPQDGTDASSQINAIFAALPDANTSTRNVLFLRPTTRYQANSRLNITVDGTQVLCGGNHKVTLKNATSSSLSFRTPWFRGAGQHPCVRMEGVAHVSWHGGGWAAASDQSTGGHLFEMTTVRFGVLSSIWTQAQESLLHANGVGGSDWTELCFANDCHVQGTSSAGGDDRDLLRWGGISYRATSGKTRNCASYSTWGSGTRNGIDFDEAHDCMVFGGYSEGQSLSVYRLFPGALRIFVTSGAEGNSNPLSHEAGSTGVLWGITGGPSGGSTDFHHFHWNL